MRIKDHFLTQEDFELIPTQTEGVLSTYPVPKNLDSYYASDKYISHHQDSNSLKERVYKIFQNYNLNYKDKILKKYLVPGASVLDYGCGAGQFLKFIQKDFNTFGFEPNAKALGSALSKSDKTKFYTEFEKIDKTDFDAITLWHVLEHIENQEDILNKFYNILGDNGLLIVALPNFASYDAKYYKEFWAAYDVPRHLHHYSREGFLNFIDQSKWKLEKIAPLQLDAFYISILSEQYRKNPFFWISGPVLGLISNFKALFSNNFSSLIYILRKIEK